MPISSPSLPPSYHPSVENLQIRPLANSGIQLVIPRSSSPSKPIQISHPLGPCPLTASQNLPHPTHQIQRPENHCASCQSSCTGSTTTTHESNSSSSDDSIRDGNEKVLSEPKIESKSSKVYAYIFEILTKFHDSRLPLGLPFTALLFIIRLNQFVLALAVCAVYSSPLVAASRRGFYIDPRWVYTVIIASASALYSAVCLCLPFTRPWGFYFGELLLSIGWLVVFGIMGRLYIPEDAEGNKPIKRMKDMVWIDLSCLLLWLFTTVMGLWFLRPKQIAAGKSSLEPESPPPEGSGAAEI